MRRILLACGILSSALYVATNFLGAALYPGYSLASNTISELFAIGAPPQAVVALLLVIYDVLLYAFGVGVWLSAGQRLALRVAAVGMIGKEILGLLATVFFPMHTREVLAAGGGTLTDEMHRDLTIVGTLFMLTAMVASAVALGKWFRIYTILTIVLCILGGVSALGDAERMAANLPTPLQGVKERVNAYGYMLWVAVLAVTLLRAERAISAEQGVSPPSGSDRPAIAREEG